MIEVVKGDITKVKADAIVNAANTSLLGGGGVDGAIHRTGGPDILAACRKIRDQRGGCRVGEAVITTGGRLPAKYVIHTVGPVWNGGGHHEADLLQKAYENSLMLAEKNGLTTIAFPGISTGIYHYPKEDAAKIAIQTSKHFLNASVALKKVIFVCFDTENFEIYNALVQ